MKKLTAIVLCSLLLISMLTGCSNKQIAPEAAPAPQTTPTT